MVSDCVPRHSAGIRTATELRTQEPDKASMKSFEWRGSRVITEDSSCHAKPQEPEKGSSRLFEWRRSVVLKGTECDAESLAARRKRSEIRRFKILAAACSCSNVEQPPAKKLRVVNSNGLHIVARTCDAANARLLMLGIANECVSDLGTIAKVSAMAITEVSGVRPMISCESEDSSPQRIATSYASTSACPSHCVMSICGHRREMEDAAIAVPAFLTLPSSGSQPSSAHTFHFFGVYDGHGGAQAAEFCKERLHGVLAEEISASGHTCPSQWSTSLQACFQKLDDELCGVCPHGLESPCKVEKPTPSTKMSSCREPLVPGSVGSTAVVAVVGSSHVLVGNCGDSRAVLSRGGQVVPLSFDHKADRQDEVARIEAAGGYVFPWDGYRVCGVLAMSRALGDRYLKPYVIGEPEVTCTARTDDDECLILASDGLWNVLSNEYVCNVARTALANWHSHRSCLRQHTPENEQGLTCDSESADSPAHVVAALLTKLALAKKSTDNISVIVVDLKHL